jgi:starch synthase
VKNKHTNKKIWMVSREYNGLAGAGGVKDVCQQLAETLVQHGNCTVQVVLPRYGFMDVGQLGFKQMQLPVFAGESEKSSTLDVDMNYPGNERREQVSFWQQTIRGVTIYLVESERFSDKQDVYTYTPEEEELQSWQAAGSGHIDYFAMNILLQKAAMGLMILLEQRPDVIHCHDGHAATLPAMMRETEGFRYFFRHSAAVVTIHNAGLGYHQEVADLDFALATTGLPESVVKASLLNNCFDPFLAAAPYAALNTVSENYARELQQTLEDERTGWLGHTLLKLGVTLTGITNGINPAEFSPDSPANADRLGLAAPFNPAANDLEGKRLCKQVMLSACQPGGKWQRVQQAGSLLEDINLPLFTFIGRVSQQKGIDILLQAIALLTATEEGFQLLILGSGDPALSEMLTNLTRSPKLTGRICFLKGYDPQLANQIYAAGDFFLIPSLYEPCGLTDYIAQLLGNLPIVHRVGGLVKVMHGQTGFSYQEHSAAALCQTMQQALNQYRNDPEGVRIMQQTAVQRIHSRHSWQRVMEEYLELYQLAQ